ncbi:putative protein TPRXL [Pleuronectes platessa]|uniref:putative protein TPRXL n=1 Tax=Pleuronectes platessa TaxID=8262 RepID=UPI00232A5448|nr:putative protein TPRXL [Pleuronectes platessa]
MMMNNVLVGLFLGLLAVVQMTPVPSVTEIPAKAEEDVLREAVTDGFLVNFFTTESPKTIATSSQQPPSDPKEEVTVVPTEEPTEEPSEDPSEESTTAVFIQHGGDHNTTTTDPSTTHSSPSGSTPSSVPNDTEPSTTTHTAAAQTTDPAVSSFLRTLSSDSGSGDGEDSDQDTTWSSSWISVSNTDSSTSASTSTAAFIHLFEDGEGSGSGLTAETSTAPSTSTAILFQSTTPGPEVSLTSSATEEEAMNETSLADNSIIRSGRKLPSVVDVNHPSPQGAASSTPGLLLPIVEVGNPQQGAASSTPGWIIILGFIVGVAMLVMLCVAIATRDKWNGPRKVSEAETKTESSDQQRGQEMETFLPKDKPMENGKSEYTVIPLEELPESYSSH